MPGGTALFGSSAGRSQNKNLVEFKAGKMTMKGKMVHPDKRKGLVYVYQSDDSLMHFCWKDRTSGAVEDDLIIFPDDVEFKRVPQCTTGRVYILKFKSSSRKFFFWVQEPKTEKDEDNCRKVNELLNNPPSLGSQRSGGATPDGDLQNLLSNMSQQQLMQLFGGVGQIGGLSSLLGTMGQSNRSSSAVTSSAATSSPSPASQTTTTTPKVTATPAAPSKPAPTPAAPIAKEKQSAPIKLSQLQNYLSGLRMQGQSEQVDLASSMTAESLQAVLNNPDFVKELQRHLPSTGSEATQEEQLKATVASPQFQQALSFFSTALQSGQLGPVVQQMGVGSDAVSAANQGNMEAFIKALQSLTPSQSSAEGSSKPEEKKEVKGKEDDEDMSLD